MHLLGSLSRMESAMALRLHVGAPQPLSTASGPGGALESGAGARP